MFRVKTGDSEERIKTLHRFLLLSIVPLSMSRIQHNIPLINELPLVDVSTPVENNNIPRVPLQKTPQPITDKKNPKCTPLSTRKLIQARDLRNQCKPEGKPKSRARALDERVKLQKDALLNIAEDIHHGSKDDLITGLAEMVSRVKTDQNLSKDEWDGSLSVQDVIEITRRAYSSKCKKSLYEILTKDHFAQNSHVFAVDIIKIQDHCSTTEFFEVLEEN